MVAETKATFSPREMETLALAWQCFESEPKIDFQKLALLAGYTEGSARTTIGNLKRKLKASAALQGVVDGSGTPKTPKSGGGGRPKKRANNGEDESPSKRKASAKSRGKTLEPQYDEEEELMEVKIKKEELLGLQLESAANDELDFGLDSSFV